MTPPLMGQASPSSALGAAMSGAANAAPGMPPADPMGMGAAPPDLGPLIEKIRMTQQGVDEISMLNPALAPMADQVRQLLRQMVVQVATMAPVQTPSAGVPPMGGGMPPGAPAGGAPGGAPPF